MDDYIPTITISAKDYPGIILGIDDTGTLTLSFKVVGVNKGSSNMPLMEGNEDTSYTLEYQTEKISKDDVSLSKAAERAADKETRVVTRVQPAP